MSADGPRRASCGRADLLRLLAAGLSPNAAEFAGYRFTPPEKEEETEVPIIGVASPPSPEREKPPPTASGDAEPLFWRATGFEVVRRNETLPPEEEQAEQDRLADAYRPVSAPELKPLGSFARLAPALRGAAALRRETREIDVGAVTRRVGRGDIIARLPWAHRRRWGERLCVVSDRSERLIPYRRDYEIVLERLERFFPAEAVEEALWREEGDNPVPARGRVVLAFTDLGALATDGDAARRAWAAYGRRLRAAGCHPVALLPGAPLAPLGALSRLWRIIGWRGVSGPLAPEERRALLDRLLVLAAPALRIEPGLLRELRLLLGAAADPSLEAEFWQSPALASRHIDGATMGRDERNLLLQRFAALPGDLRENVVAAALPAWRPQGSRFTFGVEVKSLDAETQKLASPALHAAIARDFGALAQAARSRDPCVNSWFRAVAPALSEEAWRTLAQDPGAHRAFLETWRASHPNEAQAPPGYDPALLERSTGAARSVELRQCGARIVAVAAGERRGSGSPLGTIATRSGEFAVESLDDFWKSGAPPAFAESWGCDEIGPWFMFSIPTSEGPVAQKMRWIAPGKFLMGSPEDEEGRRSNEGPRHEVTISKGFWLGDTACTQALWRAVTGDDPSRFKGADRPVENVSWSDAQRFLKQINARVPGLELCLPSEAQWEYACRAGTTTPFSFGENITPERVNYDGNYPYAGGAKGLNRQETVPVASLPANAWGLFEMHGNVFEWSADGLRRYEDQPAVDPIGPMDESAGRVLRGGSWDADARRVRSAFRLAYDLDGRYGNIGFRCARVQDGAEPVETRRVPRSGAERTAASPSGGAERARFFVGAEGAEFFPRSGPFVLRSDCERLTVAPLALPPWAVGVGRDRFGLWTEIEVLGEKGPVRQKLRWINPGRFLMGSPASEAESFDNEGPQHEVMFSKGFWLFDTACTQALWMAVMKNNPSHFQYSDRPVERVSWDDAQEFIRKINALISGLKLSLPSEAHWEYACRAGTTTPFSFGENITPEEVNYDGNRPYGGGAKGHFREETVPVESLPPNAWGLYEMHGNVWEWVEDHWHHNYNGAPADGSAWGSPDSRNSGLAPPIAATLEAPRETSAAERVLRGGSWHSHAQRVRSARRNVHPPNQRHRNIGFRCARVQE